MKTVILAGGYGTRLSEETHALPKPMVEVGGKPILWHIMKYYSSFGFNEFIVCLGYKGYVIKDYFYSYWLRQSDVTLRTSSAGNELKIHSSTVEDWEITLADTGDDVQTGMRIKNVQRYVGDGRFMLTYGDGVGNIDLNDLIKQHEASGKTVTLTAIQPHSRFGAVDFAEDRTVTSFNEKGKGKYINAGFMVAEPRLFEYLGKNEPLEFAPLETLVAQGELGVYTHNGFWKCMDTLSDLRSLETIWRGGKAPWKTWEMN